MSATLKSFDRAPPSPAALVWEAGQAWAAALVQLGGGRCALWRGSDFAEFGAAANQCPYAVCLWEVNLSNWDDRARRLAAFLRNRPGSVVAIALEGAPPEVAELFRELGAALILHHRLDGEAFLRLVDQNRQKIPAPPPKWRRVVQTPVPWLNFDPSHPHRL